MSTQDRSKILRRSGLTDRRFVTEEMHYARVIAEGGGFFRGIQKGIPGVVETVVLFDAAVVTPLGRPTLGIVISKFSLTAVKDRIAESAEKFKPGGQIGNKE